MATPVTTTRVSEQVARFHRVGIRWTATSPDALAAAAGDPNLILGADGRGGFVVPESSGNIDGIATFLHLVGLVARTQLQLSEIDARIPQAHMAHRSLPTPWAAKGSVMRTVAEAAKAGDRPTDTVDGVRVVEPGVGADHVDRVRTGLRALRAGVQERQGGGEVERAVSEQRRQLLVARRRVGARALSSPDRHAGPRFS